jgi:hypothetical protein
MSEQKQKTKKIRVTREIFEHRYLGAIAANQLARAKEEQDGHRFRWLVPSMAFSVFQVEAICNVYGRKLFPHWEHFESTSFIGKITMISEFLKIEVDFTAEPWKTLNTMKSFRNALAHAKPQKVSVVHTVTENYPNRLLRTPGSNKTILSYSSIENAERFEEVASDLEMHWVHQAGLLGIEIDTSGRPKYTVE